jgi:hypothetical protein
MQRLGIPPEDYLVAAMRSAGGGAGGGMQGQRDTGGPLMRHIIAAKQLGSVDFGWGAELHETL